MTTADCVIALRVRAPSEASTLEVLDYTIAAVNEHGGHPDPKDPLFGVASVKVITGAVRRGKRL